MLIGVDAQKSEQGGQTPGESEWIAEDDCRANSIPLHPAVGADLQKLADELDIPFV